MKFLDFKGPNQPNQNLQVRLIVYDKAGGRFDDISFSSTNLLNMDFHQKSDNELFKVTSLYLQSPHQSQSNARVYYQKITYDAIERPIYSYPSITVTTEDFFRIGELVLMDNSGFFLYGRIMLKYVKNKLLYMKYKVI